MFWGLMGVMIFGVVGVSQGQGTNLIVNGSFEKGTWNPPWLALVNGGTQVTGWVVTCQTGNQCGDYLQNWPPLPPDGIRSIDFQGQPGSHLGITQTVSTQSGVSHLITLQFSGGFISGPGYAGWTNFIGVEIDGQQTILECVTCVSGQWELLSLTFTPNTSQTTIRIFSPEWLNDPLPGNPTIDDVRLIETILDCNNNGVPDPIDIASGTSQDVNGSGIPDECDCLADIAPIDVGGNHGNGVVNIDDLVFVLNSFGQSTKPGQPTNIGDINYNGVVNIDDLVDILNGFGGCP